MIGLLVLSISTFVGYLMRNYIYIYIYIRASFIKDDKRLFIILNVIFQVLSYLPKPPLGQDMTQGQYF